ncbi:hypothetical protein AB6A23_00500 [Paenibacillus tarimensis]
MWLYVILYTLGAVVTTLQQYGHWKKTKSTRESRVFLGLMIIAWITGVLLISGVEFPTPVKPLFPGWK